MLDHLDLPPERELPERVRAGARARLLAGMREHPDRTSGVMMPLAVSAAVIVLAAIAVGVTALSGVNADMSTASQRLDTDPYRQLPPEDTTAAYHVRFGNAATDRTGRCLAEAHRDPAGRPAPEQWQPLLSATNHDDQVIAYHTQAGVVFCELTATTVALSQPAAPATSTARPAFITAFGTVAGTIDPGYRAAWFNQRLVGQPLETSEAVVVSDGVFLLPDAIPVPRNGLELAVAPTLSYADARKFTVVQDQLPAVVQPRTDAAGQLPPADQTSDAGRRMNACFHGPNSIPVVAPQAWIPGAYWKLGGPESVQLASLGPNHDLLAVCMQRTGQPIDLQIIDQLGYYNTNTIELNQLITGYYEFYNFHPTGQGATGSVQVTIVGQVLSPQVAAVRMTWPGGPNLVAAVHQGTYALPGYDENDPSLHGGKPTITVYDAQNRPLRSFPVRP
ncbi:MAG TPA: hypothetical protein VJ914_29745 [Pseudonocardiaceae bacterium]|nr:hypothetical protein [Pseudonocardiaceae bacterium]